MSVEFACFALLGLPDLLKTPVTAGGVAVYGLAAIALLGMQLAHFGRTTTRLDSALSRWLLLPQAALVYLPLLPFGVAWIGMLAFSAGTALLVLPPTAGRLAFAIVTASTWPIEAGFGGTLLDNVYNTLSTALGGLTVFLLTRLARLVSELHTARTAVARGAVAEERLQFARDLHDLIGLSLSAIALKGELALRLLAGAPERARQELADITDTARRALADVRAVARGYRELSLEQEFQAARSMLADSDVDLRLNLDQRLLPAQVRTVLASALREGVTNVLRHSDAAHCWISVKQDGDTIELDIVNDNADQEPEGDGTGLRTLTAQVTALGGTLAAAPQDGGRYRLQVRLPAHLAVPDKKNTIAAASPVGGRLATAGMYLVLIGFGLAAGVHVLYLTADVGKILLTLGFLAALLVLQLSFFSRATARLRKRRALVLLAVQACLVYLPLLELRQDWVSIPGLLLCDALLVLPPVAGWLVSAAVVASVAIVHAGFTADITDMPFNVLATVNTGFIAFGVTWLALLATELDQTRLRLAAVAVAEERLRFARDLHDLLGLSLSAITLKTELADRLLAVDRAVAANELREILSLARQALGDVRTVASGFRELSLDTESQSAEAVLTAAGVSVRMLLEYGDLPAQVGTVFAVVLREGVTNVLRHSKVEHCDIDVRRTGDQVSLEIVNDGVDGLRPENTSPSGGIRNLSDRVGMLGGQLTAGLADDGRFHLRAVVRA
ncbi:sensor histidine kinase [Kutzneria chonburiensis]|uniref:Sensor histidine kinase n=1 Tax=Kutzneria chonburiensis TaxID=1483604 RepID=A0ABV6MKW9_9PSEU|nr:histidine kinase [Kutzneria chonburiensis]